MCGLLALIALGWAGELPETLGLILYNEQILVSILALALGLTFLGVGVRKARPTIPWYDWIFAGAGLAVGAYVAVRYPILADEFFFRPTETTIIGAVLVVLGVEALRRTTGWSLLSVLLTFCVYALFGDLIPGKLAGRSLGFLELVAYLGIDNGAMLGLPMRVISTIVIVFVFLGQILLRSGGSAFFSDLSAAVMGRARGGSGKITVLASALFGSISGSAVANVASTGVITIPLMLKGGYQRHISGALVAVASTGGQIMPPVMGAAAFLMTELLGVSYGEVVLAAIIPSVLFYFSVFVQTDLEAARNGIGAVEGAEVPRLGKVLREGWYFSVPFVVLVVALFQFNMTPETSGLYAAGSIVALAFFLSYGGQRLSLPDLWVSVKNTGQSSVQVVVIGAAAGMIMGIVDVTGLGFGLTFVLVQFGAENIVLLLALTSVVCIILGMGMPTTAIYFLLATLAAPPMIQLGINPMAAHMFVLYFGCMSMITPPVALAAFTAANLAGAEAMRTAFSAMRFGWPGLVVPFLFVFSPTLLLVGSWVQIAHDVATALLGIWFTCAGITGQFKHPLVSWVRVGLIVGGIGLLIPVGTFEFAWVVELAGAVVSAFLVARELLLARQEAPA